MSRVLAALDRLGEHVNPVLVAEVRRAMRGNLFKLAFSIALLLTAAMPIGYLLAAALAGVGGVDSSSFAGEMVVRSGEAGTYLFTMLGYGLSIAVLGFVPLQAWFALSAEHEEHTLDMLSLARLTPAAIVRGKLFALLAQAALYYAAVCPFLAICFLFGGLPLELTAIYLGTNVLLCFALISIALLASSLRMGKIARLLLLVVFAMLAFGLGSAQNGILMLAREIRGLADQREFLIAVGIVALILVSLASLALAFAPGSLAHPEENTSTRPRICVSLLTLLLALAIHGGDLAGAHHEMLAIAGIGALFLLSLPLMAFVAEPERLGRRVRGRVPRSTLLALLSAPWLPGGGRGVLFAALHLGALTLWFVRRSALEFVGRHSALPASMPRTSEFEGFLLTGLYIFVFLLAVPGLLWTWTRRRQFQLASAVSPLISGFLAFVLVTWWRSLGSVPGAVEEHFANPFFGLFAIADRVNEAEFEAAMDLLLVLALAVALINAPRVVKGLLEVVSAARSRPARMEEPA